MTIFDLALLLVALLLLIPASIYFVECMVAVFRGPAAPLSMKDERPRLSIIVPAHDEQGIVGDTVLHLRRQLVGDEQVIVIADNCSDETAAESRNAGAEVWIRTDAERRGKGYAIEFAVNRLAADPPDIVVFVDADCRLSEGAVDRISRVAAAHRRPVQSQYLMSAPPSAGPLASVSALAYLIRNRVRPLGLHRLGFPCHLTGTGMAFPWEAIKRMPAQQDNLVEDLVMGLELAVAGFPPLFCGEVMVHSDFPDTIRGATSQRRRWEHGQMATLISHGPRLVSQGFWKRRLDLIVLAADLAVPPLALLVTLLTVVGVISYVTAFFEASAAALMTTAFALALVLVATVAAWARFGRRQVPVWSLIFVPAYLVWKLPIYLAFVLRQRQRDWVRTERAPTKVKPDDTPSSDQKLPR